MKNAIDILLVEDNPFEAKLAIWALEEHDLVEHLFHVEDGSEALDFIFARSSYADRKFECYPKLLLLNLKLPGISGLDVIRRLKSNVFTEDIPIIILAAADQHRDCLCAYELGVNGHIVAPVGFGEFSQAIADIGINRMFSDQPALSLS